MFLLCPSIWTWKFPGGHVTTFLKRFFDSWWPLQHLSKAPLCNTTLTVIPIPTPKFLSLVMLQRTLISLSNLGLLRLGARRLSTSLYKSREKNSRHRATHKAIIIIKTLAGRCNSRPKWPDIPRNFKNTEFYHKYYTVKPDGGPTAVSWLNIALTTPYFCGWSRHLTWICQRSTHQYYNMASEFSFPYSDDQVWVHVAWMDEDGICCEYHNS